MTTKIGRRDMLVAGSVGAATMFLGAEFFGEFAGAAQTSGDAKTGLAGGTASFSASGKPRPKAVVFDTFGTVLDWRSSIIAESKELGKGHDVDWTKFADEWRADYFPAMDRVRKGQVPWTNVDVFYRERLETLLKKYNISGLSEEEKDHWNRAWRRIKPWPDTVAGLTRLKKKFTISPLSDANFSLLTDMSKHAGLPWDCVMSAELFKHYKPDHETYLGAAALLGHKPEEMMMAAAHAFDLRGARMAGFQTGFIYRPNEYVVVDKADKAKPGDFDIVATSIVDLAAQLGA